MSNPEKLRIGCSRWPVWCSGARIGRCRGRGQVFGIGVSPLLQWLILPPMMVGAYRKLAPALLGVHAKNRAGV